MKKATCLQNLLKSQEILVMPGAYDCLSAMLIQKTGYKAVQCSGYGFAASLLGLPDCGLMTFSEVLEHTRNIVRCVDIPVMADGDTGYGNVVNVIRTVREFEACSCAGVNLEDQIYPHFCQMNSVHLCLIYAKPYMAYVLLPVVTLPRFPDKLHSPGSAFHTGRTEHTPPSPSA